MSESASKVYLEGDSDIKVNRKRFTFMSSRSSIGRRETELAYAAYEKFGRGRHKAALNMGDCFAYACAKSNNAKLLFKGGDFALTDIGIA